MTDIQIKATKSLERALKKCALANVRLYVTSDGEDIALIAVDRRQMQSVATDERTETQALRNGRVITVDVNHSQVLEAMVLFEPLDAPGK